jgi:hypothetical protein
VKPVRAVLSLLLALAGVTLVVIGPASPAQAKICDPLWTCLPLYYQELVWDPDPPCVCPELVLEWDDPRVEGYGVNVVPDRDLPTEMQQNYLGLTAQGLGLLAQSQLAQQAQNRALAARLHAQAVTVFQSAGRVLSGANVKLVDVGDLDLRKNVVGPRAIDWLTAGGEHLARGLSLFSAAAVALPQDPIPLLPAAAAELDLASRLFLTQGGQR